MKTFQDIKTQLDELVSQFIGTTISDWGAFHKQVMDIVNPTLHNCGMHYNTWFVDANQSWGEKYLSLEVDIIQDKRARSGNRMGKCVSCFFKICEPFTPDATITAANKTIRQITYNNSVDATKAEIHETKEKLKALELTLKSLEDSEPYLEL